MYARSNEGSHLQKIVTQTVKSVVEAGIPAGSDVQIRGLIGITINGSEVVLIDFSETENPAGCRTQGMSPIQSPSHGDMGHVRRSLASSFVTPTRRGRGMTPSPRGTRGARGVSPRGMTPRAMNPRAMVTRGMPPRGVPMNMRGGYNMTGTPPKILGEIIPKSNTVSNSSNGDVIEIPDDDCQVVENNGVKSESIKDEFTMDCAVHDIKPQASIPFAADMDREFHNIKPLPKLEPSPSVKSEKRPLDIVMDSPVAKSPRMDSSSNSGAEVMFKTEPSTSGQSPSAAMDSFKCPLCGKAFQFRSWFEKHLLGHENKGDLVTGACDGIVKQLINCRYCPKRFKYQKDLDAHMSSHVKESFDCNQCGAHYNNRKSLMEHMDKEHRNEAGERGSNGGGVTLDAAALGLE